MSVFALLLLGLLGGATPTARPRTKAPTTRAPTRRPTTRPPVLSSNLPSSLAAISSPVPPTPAMVTSAAGGGLSYTISGLPIGSGLGIDSVRGVINGMPNKIDLANSPIRVTVTATDPNGRKTVGTFSISIQACNADPDCAGIGYCNDGVCVPYASAGNPCGGFNGQRCLPNLFCSSTSSTVAGVCLECRADNDCQSSSFCSTGGQCVLYSVPGDPCGGSTGGKCLATLTCVNNICYDRPVVVQLPPASAVLGQPFSYDTVAKIQGLGPNYQSYSFTSFSLAGIPSNSGLSIGSAGKVTGVPNAADLSSSPLTVSVTGRDSQGRSIQGNFQLNILECNTNSQCGGNRYCTSQGTCAAYVPFGSICGPQVLCASPLLCYNSKCVECAATSDCQNAAAPSYCAATGRCVPYSNQGGTCLNGAQCAPNLICQNGVCYQCAKDADCAGNGYCQNTGALMGTCVPFQTQGGSCTAKRCNVGLTCINGLCYASLVSVSVPRQQAVVNQPYLFSLLPYFQQQMGLQGPFTYTVTGFPTGSGLSINSQGQIVGTPNSVDLANGPLQITVTARDQNGNQGQASILIQIVGCVQDSTCGLGYFCLLDGQGGGTCTQYGQPGDSCSTIPGAGSACGPGLSCDPGMGICYAATVSVMVPPATAKLGQSFSLDLCSYFAPYFPATTPVAFVISGLPTNTGLFLTAGSSTLVGIPNQDDLSASPIGITIVADDGVGHRATGTLTLTVQDIPTQVNLQSTSGTVAKPFSYDVSSIFEALNAQQQIAGQSSCSGTGAKFTIYNPSSYPTTTKVITTPPTKTNTNTNANVPTAVQYSFPIPPSAQPSPPPTTYYTTGSYGIGQNIGGIVITTGNPMSITPSLGPRPITTTTTTTSIPTSVPLLPTVNVVQGLPTAQDVTPWFGQPYNAYYTLNGLPSGTGLYMTPTGVLGGAATSRDAAGPSLLTQVTVYTADQIMKANLPIRVTQLNTNPVTTSVSIPTTTSTTTTTSSTSTSTKYLPSGSPVVFLGMYSPLSVDPSRFFSTDLKSLFACACSTGVCQCPAMVYSLTGLPPSTGLSFNSATGILSGTASAADILSPQPLSLQIKASFNGATASGIVRISFSSTLASRSFTPIVSSDQARRDNSMLNLCADLTTPPTPNGVPMTKPFTSLWVDLTASPDVCAADKVGVNGSCPIASSYDAAAAVCFKTGARLCTSLELFNDPLIASQCLLNGNGIWALSSCGPGQANSVIVNTDATNTGSATASIECTPKQTTLHVRCCADRLTLTAFHPFDRPDETGGPTVTSSTIAARGVVGKLFTLTVAPSFTTANGAALTFSAPGLTLDSGLTIDRRNGTLTGIPSIGDWNAATASDASTSSRLLCVLVLAYDVAGSSASLLVNIQLQGGPINTTTTNVVLLTTSLSIAGKQASPLWLDLSPNFLNNLAVLSFRVEGLSPDWGLNVTSYGALVGTPTRAASQASPLSLLVFASVPNQPKTESAPLLVKVAVNPCGTWCATGAVVSEPMAVQQATVGAPILLPLAPFFEETNGDTLTFSIVETNPAITVSNGWLWSNGLSTTGTLSLTAKAINSQQVAAKQLFSIGVSAQVPSVVSSSFPVVSATVGQDMRLDLAGKFSCSLPLKYDVIGLPAASGLAFDPVGGVLFGIPSLADLQAQPLTLGVRAAVVNGTFADGQLLYVVIQAPGDMATCSPSATSPTSTPAPASGSTTKSTPPPSVAAMLTADPREWLFLPLASLLPSTGDGQQYAVSGLPSGTSLSFEKSRGVLFGNVGPADLAARPLSFTLLSIGGTSTTRQQRTVYLYFNAAPNTVHTQKAQSPTTSVVPDFTLVGSSSRMVLIDASVMAVTAGVGVAGQSSWKMSADTSSSLVLGLLPDTSMVYALPTPSTSPTTAATSTSARLMKLSLVRQGTDAVQTSFTFSLWLDVDSAPPASAKTCMDLQWTPLLPGVCVNTQAQANAVVAATTRCAQALSFTNAQALCAQLGARLCTLRELASGDNKATGCTNAFGAWSIDACPQSSQVMAAPFGADTRPAVCVSQQSTVLSHAICCADQPGLTISSPNSSPIPTTAVAISPTVSATAKPAQGKCAALSWTVTQGKQACASFTSNSVCFAKSTLQTATTTCSGLGVRLCTSPEVVDGMLPTQTGVAGCPATAAVWTSTKCNTTTGVAGNWVVSSGGTVKRCNAPSTTQSVACCATVQAATPPSLTASRVTKGVTVTWAWSGYSSFQVSYRCTPATTWVVTGAIASSSPFVVPGVPKGDCTVRLTPLRADSTPIQAESQSIHVV